MNNSTCTRQLNGFIPAYIPITATGWCEVTGYNSSISERCCTTYSNETAAFREITTRSGCSSLCALPADRQGDFLRCLTRDSQGRLPQNIAFCGLPAVFQSVSGGSKAGWAKVLVFLMMLVHAVAADCQAFLRTPGTEALGVTTTYETLILSDTYTSSVPQLIQIANLTREGASITPVPDVSDALLKIARAIGDYRITTDIRIPAGMTLYGSGSSFYAAYLPIYYLVDGHYVNCSDPSLEVRQNWTYLRTSNYGTEGIFSVVRLIV